MSRWRTYFKDEAVTLDHNLCVCVCARVRACASAHAYARVLMHMCEYTFCYIHRDWYACRCIK